ncbi:MAG TPA: hypothetical protein VF278_08960 [Pirellulales bacterium]
MPRIIRGSLSLALTIVVVCSAPTAAQQHRHTTTTSRGPLAQRFDRFRRSFIGEEEPQPAHTAAAPKSTAPRLTSQSAQSAQPKAPAGQPKTSAGLAAGQPAVSSSRVNSSRRTATRSPSYEPPSLPEEPSDEPILAAEPTDAPPLSASEEDTGDEDLAEDPEPAPSAEPRHIPVEQASPVKMVKKEKKAAAAADDRATALFTRSMPRLTLRATGPKRLEVGAPADFKLVVTNDGDQPAADVVVIVTMPETAELTSTRPTSGTVDRAPGSPVLQWAIHSLAANKHEELALRIVPHDSTPIDLDVRCGCAGIAATSTLDVRQAKLSLQIRGASEVLSGEKAVYQLTVSNSGNGPAENTVIHLLPWPPEEGSPASHRVGTLAAGESKTVEVELSARQGGKLAIQARATADGGLNVAAAEEVTVRQPMVEVEVTGPARQYAGAPVTFRVRVRNPGDAPAKHVKIVANLPEAAECQAASHDAKIDVKHGRATWTLPSLPAGAGQLFTIKVLMKSPGENQLEVTAEADGELKHSNLAATDVIAVADLVLDISDPTGAVPVGQDSEYEVRVRNRGARAAEGVDIVAAFSKGVTPVSVEGGTHSLSSNGVTFETLPSLGPGQEKRFLIHAKSGVVGPARFRVELHCKSLGTKLTSEETTLYYADLDAETEGEPLAEESSTDTPHLAAPKRTRDLR